MLEVERLSPECASRCRPAEWDALVGDESRPSSSGDGSHRSRRRAASAAEPAGPPQHLALCEDDRLVAACPLYVKNNSEGEFVFDYAWANGRGARRHRLLPEAARRACPSRRRRARASWSHPGVERAGVVARARQGAARALRRARALVGARELLQRGRGDAPSRTPATSHATASSTTGGTRATQSFDDYLAALRQQAAQPDQARAPRARGAGRRDRGAGRRRDSRRALRADVPLYLTTVDKYFYGRRYLTKRFFELLRERFRNASASSWPGATAELIARHVQRAEGRRALRTLLGRRARSSATSTSTSATTRRSSTASRAGLERFEPGAGGEFKWLRGFDPEPTRSMHYVRDPRLADAVDRFLTAERRDARGRHRVAPRATARRSRTEPRVRLDPLAATLVFLSAILHATWNALTKSSGDRVVTLAGVMGHGSVRDNGGASPRRSYPCRRPTPLRFLAASAAFHFGLLGVPCLLRVPLRRSPRSSYPIVRAGSAPMLVAILGARASPARCRARCRPAGIALASVAMTSFDVRAARRRTPASRARSRRRSSTAG